MNRRLKQLGISGLRWALGLVVLLEGAHFALMASAAHQFAKTGLPLWLRPALGGGEVVAALLFLLPATSFVGGYLLLFIFAIAMVIHFLIGEPAGIGSLIVYSMAVVACLTHHLKEPVEVSHE